MSGKNHRLNPLVSRKQLLIAESDLNRAQLVQDWQAVADKVHSLANRAGIISGLAAAVGSLMAGLTTLRRKKSASASEKPSWLQTILKGAELMSTVWQVFRPQDRGQDGI